MLAVYSRDHLVVASESVRLTFERRHGHGTNRRVQGQAIGELSSAFVQWTMPTARRTNTQLRRRWSP